MLKANELAIGAYRGKTTDETAIRQAEVQGQIELLDSLMLMDAGGILTIEEEIAKYEYFRTPPRRVVNSNQDEPRGEDDGDA